MLEDRYFTLLFHRLRLLEGIRPAVIRAADAVIAAVTHGGRLMVYDETGQMTGESVYRNSGLKLPSTGMNSDGELLPVTPRDVVIIYCLMPATEKSLAALDAARDAGAFTIVVCPGTSVGCQPPQTIGAPERDLTALEKRIPPSICCPVMALTPARRILSFNCSMTGTKSGWVCSSISRTWTPRSLIIRSR